MSIKIEIINNALVITDTVSNKTLVDTPKHLVYYDVDELENRGNIRLMNLSQSEYIHSNFQTMSIGNDIVDSGDLAFTEASFKAFARTNLGV